MAINTLNELTVQELEIKLQDSVAALRNLKFQKALQQLENPLQIRFLKKEIAQVRTLLKEYKLGIRTSKAGAVNE